MPDQLAPEEELRRLTEFTSQVQDILQVVVDRPHYILPGRHHDLLFAAWQEVIPAFTALRASLTTDARPRLEEVGLVGYRLRFELGLFAHARERLLDCAPELFGPPFVLSSPPSYPPTLTPVPLPVVPVKKRKWRERLGARLLRCFKAGDVILGSLAAAFPPAEIVSQFKEGVEEGISLVRRGPRE